MLAVTLFQLEKLFDYFNFLSSWTYDLLIARGSKIIETTQFPTQHLKCSPTIWLIMLKLCSNMRCEGKALLTHHWDFHPTNLLEIPCKDSPTNKKFINSKMVAL